MADSETTIKLKQLGYYNIKISERHNLDVKAYEKYYQRIAWGDPCPTYNSWYGTDAHINSLLPLLRKIKLQKIENK